MKKKAKEQAIRTIFPWVDKYLSGGNYRLETASVDDAILDRQPSFNYQTGLKNRILLLSQSGSLLTEVRGITGFVGYLTMKLGGFSRAKQELVSEALERLGVLAEDVAFIVTITPQGRKSDRVTIYHTRKNTTVAKVWRHLAAQEESKIRQAIQAAMSAEDATVLA
ncbi:MAG: hypothetical protein ACYCZ0_02025 [Minisyncoccota bacterium]